MNIEKDYKCKVHMIIYIYKKKEIYYCSVYVNFVFFLFCNMLFLILYEKYCIMIICIIVNSISESKIKTRHDRAKLFGNLSSHQN